MNYQEFPINQSIIRSVLHNGEEREFCPRNLYITKIIKSIVSPPSSPMLYGKYFETKCLGKSARGDKVTDLPRKNLTKKQKAENVVRKKEKRPLILGEKYLDHIRVDDQVERFKTLIKKYQIAITDINTQVSIKSIWEYDPEVHLSCEIDIFPTTILLDDELSAAIIDLKLTADIHTTYGEYCYGAPQYLDLIQGKMYHYIVRNINEKMNPNLDKIINNTVKKLINDNRILFLLWVFNYKKNDLEDKFIQIKWDNIKEAELHESIRKTISILNKAESEQWPTTPNFSLCKHCPWKQCPDRQTIETV